jgi:hypothetical protein
LSGKRKNRTAPVRPSNGLAGFCVGCQRDAIHFWAAILFFNHRTALWPQAPSSIPPPTVLGVVVYSSKKPLTFQLKIKSTTNFHRKEKEKESYQSVSLLFAPSYPRNMELCGRQLCRREIKALPLFQNKVFLVFIKISWFWKILRF